MNPVTQIRKMSDEMERLDLRMTRASTTGKSGPVEVKLSGRGTLQVTLNELDLDVAQKEALTKNIENAVEEALEKQRKRAAKEASDLISS